jgi:hypothetical protein
MSTEKDSRSILDELETLQRVLDDAAGEQVDLNRALTQLNTVDDIPVLSDLFSREEPPILKAVPPSQGSKVTALKNPRHHKQSGSPIPVQLPVQPQSPNDVLEALHQEMMRKAAAHALGQHEEDDAGYLEEMILSHFKESLAPEPAASRTPATKPQIENRVTAKPQTPSPASHFKPVSVPSPTGSTPTANATPRVASQPAASTTTAQPAPSAAQPASSAAQPASSAAQPALSAAQPALSAAQPALSAAQPAPSAAQPVSSAAEATSTIPAAAPRISSNPFLPQDVLDRLTTERLAAQHSAEEAHRTMQRVMQKQQQRESEAVTRLTHEDKNQLINAIVDELTPIIQMRLREKLRNMLVKKPD